MASMPIRQGTVSSIDYDNGMISVTYSDHDDNTTVKLPCFSFTDEYRMPRVGEEVVVLHRQDGQVGGYVLGRFYNLAHPPAEGGEGLWRKSLGQDAYMRYDEYTRELLICADKVRFVAAEEFRVETKAAEIEASDSITSTTKELTEDAQNITMSAEQNITMQAEQIGADATSITMEAGDIAADAQRITLTSSQLTADSSTIAVKATTVTGQASTAVLTAATTIEGTLHVSGTVSAEANISADGSVVAGGEITSNGVSLSTHTHGSGCGGTEPPR